jgi:hypothetical protein
MNTVDEDRRTNDTPGRREADQPRIVVVDSFTNGAKKQAKKIERICMAAAVAVVLAIPTTIWSASRWASEVEESITLVAVQMEASIAAIDVRDSTMVAHFQEHSDDDAARDAAVASTVSEIGTTMAGMVALLGTLQAEVERLRDRMDDL